MAETEKSSSSSKIVTQKDGSKEPKNLFSLLFPKFEPKIPFFNQGQIKAADSIMANKEEPKTTPSPPVVEGENEKPNIVSFPNNPLIIPPPLEVELQESSGRTHNPVVIWQVRHIYVYLYICVYVYNICLICL